jgi:Tfp pilus assembly protein PilN
VLVGGLALLLLGIVAVALTSKQISDRKSEQQQLERELADATARAQSLQAFADFRALQETRASTVSSLAQTRFDWERVMNELALILPEDIWLSSLTGTVSPAVTVEGAESVDERASVNGPALEIIGCATGQDAVAGFVASLEDIDGVTRVGLSSSELPGDEESATGATGGSAAGGLPDSTGHRQVPDRRRLRCGPCSVDRDRGALGARARRPSDRWGPVPGRLGPKPAGGADRFRERADREGPAGDQQPDPGELR